MTMVCPQCNNSYEQRLHCPLCGARLLFHATRGLNDRTTSRPTPWRQSPWGRILIGLLLSQGLFYGLRQLVTGVLMVVQGRETVELIWSTAAGILLLQSVRIVALFCGAIFAGSGQRQTIFLGAMIGAWNGVLSVLFLPGPAQSLTPTAMLGQPLLQAFLGAIGSWIGSIVWKPVPAETTLDQVMPRKRSLLSRQRHLIAGPIAWFRVALGVLLAAAGALTATLFFEKL